MTLEKALKKQKRGKRNILILLYFLAFFLPLLTYLAYIDSVIVWSFLILIEFFIILDIINKLNFYKLEFNIYNNKLRIKSGIFSSYNLIYCDKVALIHTNKCSVDMEIIIITTTKSKNKILKPITGQFANKYKEANEEYLKLKKNNSNSIYYYEVIKRGALNKYILLDSIYKNCVNAVYTTSAIENIKIARGQKEI